MLRLTLSILVLFTSTLCLALRSASAAPSPTGAVLVVGKASPKHRATVASAARSAARSRGWELVEAPLSAAEISTILGCLKEPGEPGVWSCAAAVVQPRAIERLIVVRVEPDDAGPAALSITEQIVVAGVEIPTVDRRPCRSCLEETLTRITFDLTQALIDETLAATGRTTLTIRSTPPGAWITLDSNSLGATDHTYPVAPGPHVVIARLDGHPDLTRDVHVNENVDNVVTFDFAGPAQPVEVSARSPYMVPAIVTTVGVASIAGGVALQLAKDPPDRGVQPRYLPSGPGIALMVAGGLTAGLGGYLWARAIEKSRARTTPSAAITPAGAVLGWSGTF